MDGDFNLIFRTHRDTEVKAGRPFHWLHPHVDATAGGQRDLVGDRRSLFLPLVCGKMAKTFDRILPSKVGCCPAIGLPFQGFRRAREAGHCDQSSGQQCNRNDRFNDETADAMSLINSIMTRQRSTP